MADENLQERLNAPSQEGSKLEKIANEENKKSTFRKAFDLTYLTGTAIGTTVLSSAFLGPLGFIIGGALAGGRLLGSLVKGAKSKYESITDSLKTYSALNAVLAPIIWLGNVTYPIIGALGSKIAGGIGAVVAKTTYSLTAYNTAFVASFKAAHHMVDHHLNPIGITKTVRENYWPTVKRIGIGFSPGFALTANGITNIFGMPSFAVNALPYGMYDGAYPIGRKK